MFRQFNDDVIFTILKNKDKFIRSNAKNKTQSFLDNIGATLFKFLPHPFLFPKDDFYRISNASQALLTAQNKIMRHLCATRSQTDILQMFAVPETMSPYIDWDELQSGHHRVARIDLLPLAHGYEACELNIFAGVGGPDLFDAYRQFAGLTGWPLCARDHSPFDNLTALYRQSRQRLGIARLVLLDWSSHARSGYPALTFAQSYLNTIAPALPVTVHDELNYPEAWLGPGKGRGIMIHRNFTYDDITVNFDRFRAIHDSGAVFSNGFEAELLMSKAWFPLLSDTRLHPLLDSREVAAISAHVPYSFSLADSGLAAALKAKDDLVFKQNYAYGGIGVMIGRDHEAAALAARIGPGGEANWSCQTYREVPPIDHAYDDSFIPAPHKMVLGLYLHGGVASGMLVRSSRSANVVNATTGAGVTWAGIADEAEKQAVIEAILKG